MNAQSKSGAGVAHGRKTRLDALLNTSETPLIYDREKAIDNQTENAE